MTDAIAAGDMGSFAELGVDFFAFSITIFLVEYGRWLRGGMCHEGTSRVGETPLPRRFCERLREWALSINGLDSHPLSTFESKYISEYIEKQDKEGEFTAAAAFPSRVKSEEGQSIRRPRPTYGICLTFFNLKFILV
jgi:hypothetical protein